MKLNPPTPIHIKKPINTDELKPTEAHSLTHAHAYTKKAKKDVNTYRKIQNHKHRNSQTHLQTLSCMQ